MARETTQPPCATSHTRNETAEGAVENIRDAIREYLSAIEEQLRGEDVREIEVTL